MKMRKLKLGLASLAAVAVLAGCSSATTLTDASGQTATRSTATGNSGSSEALNTLLSPRTRNPTTPRRTPITTSPPSLRSP